MIIAMPNAATPQIEQLTQMLSIPNLPKDKKDAVEAYLLALKKGQQGEQEAAHYLDFSYGKPGQKWPWVVIHGLRIEDDYGRSAEMDHILINRFLDIYVLETKNLAKGLTITEEGDFLNGNAGKGLPIQSPVEQVKRQIQVLRTVIHQKRLAPKKFGVPLQPSFHPFVLTTKKTILQFSDKAKYANTIIKTDALEPAMRNFVMKKPDWQIWLSLFKITSFKKIATFAEKLTALHKQQQYNLWQDYDIQKPAD